MTSIEQFKEIPRGEVFRTVTTRHHTMTMVNGEYPELTFVCKKGNGHSDWAIYYHYSDKGVEFIKRSGDKVMSKANILSIFPCDEEVLELYRF
jgi:hypothetical protein